MSTPHPLLTSEELEIALAELPGWTLDGTCLQREFEFRNFRRAFAFMTQVAMWCEKLNHHPNWENAWNKVTIRLCTHDAGGVVTSKDIELAAKISAIVD